jgi:glycosyltransferase involved in cell wall biosynthesis
MLQRMSTPPLKIAYITAGAAGMYCGSCMHDNTLARALSRIPDVECLLIPTYTPIRTDEENVSQQRIFMGGINVYLEQRFPLLRFCPSYLKRLLDRPGVIRWATSRGIRTDAKQLGALTVSMLKGMEGRQRREVLELTHWLAQDLQPQVINLTNILIAGFVPYLKQSVGTTVLVTLQGDDIFLRDLPAPFQSQALAEIQRLGKHVDGFVVHSLYYADFMSSYLQLPAEKFRVTPLGIDLEGFPRPDEPDSEPVSPPLTLGYLARLAPEKGLHLLVDAFLKLKQLPETRSLRLAVAGWLGEHHRAYAEAQFQRVRAAGYGDDFEYVGSVDRAGKIAFLRRIDLLSVPSPYQDPKGLYVLEALAAGKPVVQPAHGAFPELLESTGGGQLFKPGDADDLVRQCHSLLTDTPQRRTLGRQGQQAVHQHYNATTSAEQDDGADRGVGPRCRGDSLAGSDGNRDSASLLLNRGLDLADFQQFIDHGLNHAVALLDMRHLTTSEDNGNLDLVLLAQESLRLLHLEVNIMCSGLGAEPNFLRLRVMRMLVRLLLLVVFVFPVVHDATNGWTLVGSHFDQVQLDIPSVLQRLVSGQNA